MTSTPHDALFKAGFGRPDIARSELELMLPREVTAQLDLATLEVCPGSFVGKDLSHAHTDLLFSVRTRSGREALVFVLFEHQSSPDALMALRFLGYIARVWDRWIELHPNAKTVPLVLPVLLHHGPAGWKPVPELASVLDADPELLEATRAFVPHFRYMLDDLAALSIDELANRTIEARSRLVQMAFWSARSQERLVRVAPFMEVITRMLKHDPATRTLLDQIYRYMFDVSEPDVELDVIRSILLKIAGPEGYEDVMNAGQQLREQGRAEGLEKGLEKGRTEGLAGLRSAIETILLARGITLSELGRARLAACADIATLTAWTAHAATAVVEADVFSA